MREQTFIKNNLLKWENAETTVEEGSDAPPDELASAYIDVTSDLTFAQTHWPRSQVTVYLNGLAAALHNAVYRNKREPYSRLLTFWTREVPAAMYSARRLLLASLLIFVVSAAIGWVSQYIGTDFCRLILGDNYVDMTEQNIIAGKPMGVYGTMPEGYMFGTITFNNIGVAFRIFVSGLLTSVATGIMLFYNGMMIGCFDAFFAQRGMLPLSLLTTMLHGTLELSAIVIAGAAGLAMGNGWLFPGTYTRLESFRRGAMRGLKIVLGTVPTFIVAGFIEGFITRHTAMPVPAKLAIIILSAAFVVFYYVAWPYVLHKKTSNNPS